MATFLRDDPDLAFDFLSNVTGVDWPDKEITEKVKVTRQVTKTVDGVEQTVEETVEETRKRVEPGYLEAVYHLYSVAKKHGPLVHSHADREPHRSGGDAFAHAGLARRPSFRSARSSISTELSSPAIRTCAAF